jgi:hypothetical protein
MWVTGIFTSVVVLGIAFLLWFLFAIRRELPLHLHAVRQSVPKTRPTETYRMQLGNEWIGIRDRGTDRTFHSIWRYSAAQYNSGREEFSCEILFLS